MHEPFDDEIRSRLLNYKEKSNPDLWRGIARRITSTSSRLWKIWTTRCLFAIFLVSISEVPSEDVALQDAMHPGPTTMEDDIPVETLIPSPGRSAPTGRAIAPARDLTRPAKPNSTSIIKRVPELANRSFDEGETDQENHIALNNGSRLSEVINIETASESLTSQQTIRSEISKEIAASSCDSAERKTLRESQHAREKQLSISLYFTAMPTFGYQRIESNNHDNIFIEGIKRVPAFSADRLGVRIELGAALQVPGRWTLLGGLVYLQRKQTIEYLEKQTGSLGVGPALTDIKIRPQFTYAAKTFEYELRNLGMQVGITYQLAATKVRLIDRNNLLKGKIRKTGNKFVHTAGSGIEFQRPLAALDLTGDDGVHRPSMFVFLDLYYRLQYPNSGKFRALFQPTLNYSFYINEDLNAPFYVKPYLLGLNFGCTYTF